MRKLIIVTLAAVAAGAGTVASAAGGGNDSHAYLGATYTRADYKESGVSSLSPSAIGVVFGWNFNPNFAIEGRAGTSAQSASTTVLSTVVDVKVKSYYGVLLRGTVPVGDNFDLYAVAGYMRGELEATSGTLSATTTDNSASYAVGGEFNFGTDARSGVSLEYGRYFSGTGYDVNGLTLGYRYRF